MINQKRGLTDSVSYPKKKIYRNPEQKKITTVGLRWAKQQTRSSGPNQLNE